MDSDSDSEAAEVEYLSLIHSEDSDRSASDFDLDTDRDAALKRLSRGVNSALAEALLRKMTLDTDFLERRCQFQNIILGIDIDADGGSVAAAISIMEGHILFFWRLVDAGVSLRSLISMYHVHYGRRDTMTLGALAMLSLVRQCPGANRDDDRCKDQIADAWKAHDCETVLRSILTLLERGVELSENMSTCEPLLEPGVEHYSLGASAVVTAAESGHWDTVDRLLEKGIRLEDRSRNISVIHEWLYFYYPFTVEADLRSFEVEQAETGYSSEPIATWWAFESLHYPSWSLRGALLTEPARRQITRGLLKACRTSNEMPPACLTVLVKFAYLGLAQDFFDLVVKLENPRWFDQRWSPGERALRWCLEAIVQESGRAHRLRRLRALQFLEKRIMEGALLVESFLGYIEFKTGFIRLPTEMATPLTDPYGAMLGQIAQLHFPLVRVLPPGAPDRNGSLYQLSAPVATLNLRCIRCEEASATWFGWECQKSTGGCGRICP